MEFTREHFRAMILYDFKSKLTQKQCIDRLSNAFGNGAPSKGTIYRWFREFEIGRANICDESREGRPATAVVPENIAAVRRMVKRDPHITYREIKAVLRIAMTQIQTILHQHLAVTKVCSRWIPDKVSEDEKMKRQQFEELTSCAEQKE
uniref:Mos1 transposase HTH domain-containing protein n=1 Tax=Lutzomyia longipalpis TaxID=7200 RepID=A0A1B0CCE2_LUTLO